MKMKLPKIAKPKGTEWLEHQMRLCFDAVQTRAEKLKLARTAIREAVKKIERSSPIAMGLKATAREIRTALVSFFGEKDAREIARMMI